MSPDDPQAASWRSIFAQLRRILAERFSLIADKAEDATIERRIREGAELAGATPWILMFAIVVASIGLNVNSTAVIIGAMLISPLMGPIMGIGLGVAVYDFQLVKRTLINLAIATLISLLASALYFAVSPLQEAQSELLARTAPTLWDVLIALFGGFAGVIGVTRHEKSNVIPGVAIATALMPPVCTAGYGLANGEWGFVAGALYLYTINCVFIALATIVGIRVLRLKPHGFADSRVEKRVKLIITALALCTTLPSVILAWNLVQAEYFKSRARDFLAREFAFPATHVAEAQIDAKRRVMELSLIGEPIDAQTLKMIEGRLALADLPQTRIIVHQDGDTRLDVTALRSSLLSDLYQGSQEELRKKDAEVLALQKEIEQRDALFQKAQDIADELRAQYPGILRVFVSEGVAFENDSDSQRMLQLAVVTSRPMPEQDKARIESWFKVRARSEQVMLQFDTDPRTADR